MARRQIRGKRNWLQALLGHKKFDPEGTGYDYASAVAVGIGEMYDPKAEWDEKKKKYIGHWKSRVPSSGLLLKGRKHRTWHLLEKGERKAHMKIYKRKDGRYYSRYYAPISDAPKPRRVKGHTILPV